jgi:hypothetical protein
MTEGQAVLFWRLFGAASRYQQWTASEAESRRRDILMECGFRSAKEIDRTDGFDRVKKRLEELSGRIHNEPEDAGRRRRVLARVGHALADLNAAGYPPRSLNTLLAERFKIIEGVRTVADLDTVELANLSRTLTARLAAWRKRFDSPAHAATAAAAVAAAPPQPLCSAIAGTMQHPFFIAR